jgi:carboxypeptidase C (cathepsin A)
MCAVSCCGSFAAGESYAGIYVPMLAREVGKGNRRGVKPHINIQVRVVAGFLGFM